MSVLLKNIFAFDLVLDGFCLTWRSSLKGSNEQVRMGKALNRMPLALYLQVLDRSYRCRTVRWQLDSNTVRFTMQLLVETTWHNLPNYRFVN